MHFVRVRFCAFYAFRAFVVRFVRVCAFCAFGAFCVFVLFVRFVRFCTRLCFLLRLNGTVRFVPLYTYKEKKSKIISFRRCRDRRDDTPHETRADSGPR